MTLRVTYVSPYVPYAQIPYAGGQFLFHHLDRMSQRFDARLLAPGLDANRQAVDRVPDGLRGKVHLVPIVNPRAGCLSRALRSARTAAGGLTMGLDEVRAFTDDAGAAEAVIGSDVVEVHWSEALPLVPLIQTWVPEARIVAVEYDVRYQALRGRSRRAQRRSERLLSTVAAARVKRQEPWLLNRCDAALVHTDKEVELLRRLGVTIALEKMVPYLEVPVEPVGPADAERVLFVGAFDRRENSEAAYWLLDSVWPAIRAARPGATMVIGGAHPPPALAARADTGAGIEITGFVDDLGALYRSARVALCPLLTGAGLKYKVPQAMLYGLPVVASPVAADGIIDRSGPSVFAAVSEDPNVLAAATVRCLEDTRMAADVGARARQWAVGEYRFDDHVDRVASLYERLVAGAPRQ